MKLPAISLLLLWASLLGYPGAQAEMRVDPKTNEVYFFRGRTSINTTTARPGVESGRDSYIEYSTGDTYRKRGRFFINRERYTDRDDVDEHR